MSTPYKKIAFHTLGCKLNFTETATIARDFSERGFLVTNFKDQADVYVINTCSVTENADRECRKIVRQVKRRQPHARIALVGCYAQLQPDAVAVQTGADIVLGSGAKFKLIEHLEKGIDGNGQIVITDDNESLEKFTASWSYGERTRAILKIQDGCDYRCSYCTIPMARGRSRSDSVKNTLAAARDLAGTEALEIVLTGVNIGDFGAGTDETFLDLIRELDNLPEVDRIRISSIEPNLLTDEIIDFCSTSRLFVPHFHIPLQSGSNRILKDMKRRYPREVFENRVTRIRQSMPDCCIGVDVITGFPTETSTDFMETYDFLKNLDITYLHVFTYSERPGTVAAGIPRAIPPKERNRRSKMLHILSDKKRNLYHHRFTGQTLPVLFESQSDGMLIGHTRNYIKVAVFGDQNLLNGIHPVKLIKNNGRYMTGQL